MPKPLTELQCRVLRALLHSGPMTAEQLAQKLCRWPHSLGEYRKIVGALRSLYNLCLVRGRLQSARGRGMVWHVADCDEDRARAALAKYEAAKEAAMKDKSATGLLASGQGWRSGARGISASCTAPGQVTVTIGGCEGTMVVAAIDLPWSGAQLLAQQLLAAATDAKAKEKADGH